MNKKNKTYDVFVSAKYSESYTIKAKNKSEAKKKAIDKFRAKRSFFEADATLEEFY